MGFFGSLAASVATLCVAAKITQRKARRNGASTGCSGLCPRPKPSQTLPNLPNSIARHPGVRPTTAYRMPQYSAYARLRYTTPWQAGSIYLNSQRPYSRKRETSRLLCQKQALHIFTRRRRTSRSQRNADCTNSWRQYFTVYYRLLPLVTVKPPSTVQPGLPRPPCNST